MCWIWDILALTPLIESLKQTKCYDIYVLSAWPAKKIFENDTSINVIEFKYWFKYLFFNLKIINSYNFDLIFNSFREEYNWLITCLSNVKYKCWYLYSNKITSNNLLINKKNLYPCKFFSSYDVRKCALNLTEILEIENAKSNWDYKIFLNKNNKVNINQIITNKLYKNIIVIFIDNQWYSRSWDILKWIELTKNLLKDNVVIVIWQNKNKDIYKSFFIWVWYNKNLINCIDRFSILETSSLISQADILITTDSWPLHIWFTTKVKNIICLFWPTNPKCVFIKKSWYKSLYQNSFTPKVSHYFLPISNNTINIMPYEVLEIIKNM